VFDFRAHFCHSAPMETHAFGFRLRANDPEGQKRFLSVELAKTNVEMRRVGCWEFT
jgi:hypothetical protein